MVINGSLRSLLGEVARERGEEARGHRDDPLVAALAVGDEQPSLTRADITEPQAQHLAAAQAAEQHRLGHRPVPGCAQRRDEDVNLIRVDHPRQRPWRPDQRDTVDRPLPGTAHRQAARHRVLRHHGVAADDQVLVESRDRRQATLDGAGRQPALAVLDADHHRAVAGFALGLDERQHVGGDDIGGILADDREEHLQIERSGDDRIRSRLRRHQFQIRVQQRMTEPDQVTAARSCGVEQARDERHQEPSDRCGDPPSRHHQTGSGSPAYRDQPR